MKKETVNQEELFQILAIFETEGFKYWLDGGWGVDVLTGKQNREHRDVDIDFDAEATEQLVNLLQEKGFEIVTDWLPVRMELWHADFGYLDIHPFILNEDGSAKQADLEGGYYQFAADFFTKVNYQGKEIPCISKKAQQLFHTGYELREVDKIDMKNLAKAPEQD